MNRKEAAGLVSRLAPAELLFASKLLGLMAFCPGFNKELDEIVPNGCETVSKGQLEAASVLMDKWLYEEGYAEIIRLELEGLGCGILAEQEDAE